MATITIILKMISTIASGAAALLLLWGLLVIRSAFGNAAIYSQQGISIVNDTSVAALLAVIGAVIIMVAAALVWVRPFRVARMGLTALGVILPWLAYAIQPNSGSSAFIDTAAINAFVYLVGAIIATGGMGLAGLDLVLDRRTG